MGTPIPFTKMHGLGNDFVLINRIANPVNLGPEHYRRIADRRFGIGCDQVLLLDSPSSPEADFAYRIFNADGGEVEQCGNGARCFARYVRDKGLSDKDELAVETIGGMIYPRINPDGTVTVNMGVPRFGPVEIPFVADQEAVLYPVEVDGTAIDMGVVSMGNPHAVQLVEDVDVAPVETQGPLIEHHARFPNRVNAGFMQIKDRHSIRLRVFERGAGETLACGTGACAASVVGRQMGLLDDTVDVELPGGHLEIRWEGPGQPVLMRGPAVTVFEGTVDLQELMK
jgi:diaminopimelate epimerase